MILRHLCTLLVCAGMLGLTGCAGSSTTDSVVQAKRANDARFSNDEHMRKAASFLVEMTDARMMDAKEGEVAASRGVASDVKSYGTKMIHEQGVLLDEIRTLASEQGITLPQQISDEKSAGLKSLQAKSGKDLDSQFINMSCIDHKRDVKEFQQATNLSSAHVSAYARRRLPTIQEHLDEIEKIKSSR